MVCLNNEKPGKILKFGDLQENLFCINTSFTLHTFYSSPPHLFSSTDTRKSGKWRSEQQDVEDHGFRPGQGMAQNYQNERSWDLCLDGSRGHPLLNVLQRQRCLEVLVWH